MRHPKGARPIGIGHQRSGNRCAETSAYPLDPLGRRAEIPNPGDPAGASRISGSQAPGATPLQGRGRLGCLIHGSSGLRLSTTCQRSWHPQGVLIADRSRKGEALPDAAPQVYPAEDPGRGPFCLARWSRHEVPKTPGFQRHAFMIRPRQGSLVMGIAKGASPHDNDRGDLQAC